MNETDKVLALIHENERADPNFYADPNAPRPERIPVGPHERKRENMGTFAVIRNDGTVFVVNAESEQDVIDNVLGSSALNYVRVVEPYDPEKHLPASEVPAWRERQAAIAAGQTPDPTVPADLEAALASVVDKATLDAALRRVLGLPEPAAPVEPATPDDPASAPEPPVPTAEEAAAAATPDAAVNDGAPVPSAPVEPITPDAAVTPDPAPTFDVSAPVEAPVPAEGDLNPDASQRGVQPS